MALTRAMNSETPTCTSTGIRVGSIPTMAWMSPRSAVTRGGRISGTAWTTPISSVVATWTRAGSRVGMTPTRALIRVVNAPTRVGSAETMTGTTVGISRVSSPAMVVSIPAAPVASFSMKVEKTAPKPCPVCIAVEKAGAMSTKVRTSMPSGLTEASNGPTAVKTPVTASRTRSSTPTIGESSSMPNALPRSAVKSPRASRADKPSTADEARSTTPTSLGPTMSSSLPRPFAVASTTGSSAAPIDSLKLPHLVASFSAAVALAAAAPPT